MKHRYYKILSLILTLAILLCSAACQGEQPPTPPDEKEDIVPEVEQPTEIQLSAKYVLIRPDEKNEKEVQALQLLKRGLESVCGESFSLATDYPARDESDESANVYEILIGATNREASQTVFETLTYNDWSYRVIDAYTVVICGGSPEATYTAVTAFLKDVFGYTEDAETGEVLTAGSATMLKVGTISDYHHQYAISSFVLGKHEISSYSIVTASRNGYDEAAQEIVDHFLSLTGVELPVLTLNTYQKEGGGPAIFLGCTSKDGTHLDVQPYSKDRYYIFGDGDHIILDFKNVGVALTAAKRFIKECTPGADAGESVTISFSSEQMLTGLAIPRGTNHLELDSKEVMNIASGVVYEERLYYDENGKPVRAYMITIAKGAATIATSLPRDEGRIGTYATVLEQVIAASENGKKVVAGINADFFGSTMLGLCVRDGVELHDVSGRPWFGITLDGEAVLGTAYEYTKYTGQLLTAVGGSNIVINNDSVDHISVDDEFGYTRHPRTAVGIKADGSVVLLVVDGRQSKISNGASLADLADILGSVGCVEALNLDGGGSSTFVVVDENGEFDVANSPSDGSLRETANGLMVILP